LQVIKIIDSRKEQIFLAKKLEGLGIIPYPTKTLPSNTLCLHTQKMAKPKLNGREQCILVFWYPLRLSES